MKRIHEHVFTAIVLRESHHRREESVLSTSNDGIEATFQQVGSFPRYGSKAFFAHTLVRLTT